MDSTTLLIVLAVAAVVLLLIKKKAGDAPVESATDAGDAQLPEVLQEAAPAEEDASESHADVDDGSDEDAPVAVEEVEPSAFDAGGAEASAPSEMAAPFEEAAPVEEEASSSAFGAEDAGRDGSTEDDQQDTSSRDGDPYA